MLTTGRALPAGVLTTAHLKLAFDTCCLLNIYDPPVSSRLTDTQQKSPPCFLFFQEKGLLQPH